MSTLGSKNKVVRTEILHILVPKPSRGDLDLTISRPSKMFPISSQSQFWQKIESPGHCHLRVPTRRYGYQNVQNFGANNFGFRPKVDIPEFLVLFLTENISKLGTWAPGLALAPALAPALALGSPGGALGVPGGPWGGPRALWRPPFDLSS